MKFMETKVVKTVSTSCDEELFPEYINRGWKVVEVHPINARTDSKAWTGAIVVLKRSCFSRWYTWMERI